VGTMKKVGFAIGIVLILGLHTTALGSAGSPWGISPHQPDSILQDTIKALGTDWMRCDFYWKDIEKLFIFIEGNSNIKFKEYYDDKEIDNGYGLIIKSLVTGTTKSIEFIYPESINIENNLIFISPLFDELDFLPEPGICDSDKVCEKSKGENYKNCRNDCKPWKLTFLFLIILLIVTFVIYVSLQEWYKRYYESYLFKDKNQLFNLITFMSICISGIKLEKNEIYGKLKQSGWKGEQIEYAWRKLHGMRTGMWEIPIFKIFERKKVAEEIEKRKVFFGNTPRSFNPEKRL